VILLWELGGRNDRRYSVFSWRSRMALAHKGLDFEARPVCMSDKAAIAFSGGKTVPVMRDGDSVVRDSWKIAEHLESRYPDKPLFGGDIARGVTHAFNTWIDRALVAPLLEVLAPDIHERVDPADETYFRETMQKFVKMTLEEARAKRDEGMRRLTRTLEPMQALLKRQPWIAGAQPAYGDYILFSVFQWARIMSPQVVVEDGLVSEWRERMLDLHGAFARNVATA